MAEVKKKKSKKTNNATKKTNGGNTTNKTKKMTSKSSNVKKDTVKKTKMDTTNQITITTEQLNLAFEEDKEVKKIKEVQEEPVVIKTRSELHQDTKINKEVNSTNYKKSGKLTDIGTFIILIGMLALVIITYITTAYSLSYLITNIFVGASLVVETIGIVFIVISLFKTN